MRGIYSVWETSRSLEIILLMFVVCFVLILSSMERLSRDAPIGALQCLTNQSYIIYKMFCHRFFQHLEAHRQRCRWTHRIHHKHAHVVCITVCKSVYLSFKSFFKAMHASMSHDMYDIVLLYISDRFRHKR